MYKIDLNGSWQLKRLDWDYSIEAAVPGDVYNTLLEHRLIEDPFYRENEESVTQLSYFDYSYTRTFQFDDKGLSNQHILLCLEGVDTLGEVYLNNTLVGKTENMHRRYELNVKPFLKLGENTLLIILRSPTLYCEERHKNNPILERKDSLKGSYYLRKAHSMFGWDWGPRLPNLGIWRDVYLQGVNDGRIEAVHIRQNHTHGVTLNISTLIEAALTTELRREISIFSPEGQLLQRINDEAPFQTAVCSIASPQLWWPRNYGLQPLYQVEVKLFKSDNLLDYQVKNIGLRTLHVNRVKDQWGESFTFIINKLPIFLMGADYIPEDNLLGRTNEENTNKLLEQCVEANFNCVRVWGGGHYPSDYFYDLCDKKGLIVWQDFMFACMVYDLSPEFVENISQELVDNIRRIRHHACLGIWCGNNEIEWGLSDDWLPDNQKAREDYLTHFNKIIPSIVSQEDPDTFYWPSSPSGYGEFNNPNGDNEGDMHYWGVWHDTEPFTKYRDFFPRFMSEFGLQSFPSIKTVEAFTLPEDRNIFSPVMENHQKNSTCNAKILHYISENFRYPKDFTQLLTVSQLIQAEGIKYGVEHFRRNRPRCMGAIYWQLNDCWPVASWSSIDYYGRWKALHYTAKRFYTPILVSAMEMGPVVQLHVSNETIDQFVGELSWSLQKSSGEVLINGVEKVQQPSLTTVCLINKDFSDYLSTTDLNRSLYLRYELSNGTHEISQGTVIFVKPKHFAFQDPEIRMVVGEAVDSFSIVLFANAYAKYTHLDFKTIDGVFSDNFFDLHAHIPKTITILKTNMSESMNLEKFESELQVNSLFNTYSHE